MRAQVTAVGDVSPASLAMGELSIGSVVIGDDTVGNLRIEGGVTLDTGSVTLGETDNGIGFASVSGLGTVWESSGLLEIGNNGFGRVDVTSAAVVNTSTLILGNQASGTGTLTVDGLGSTVQVRTTSGAFAVGSPGPGRLEVRNNGLVSSPGTTLNISANGVVELDGGLVRANDFNNNGVIVGGGELQLDSTNATGNNRGLIQVRPGELLRVAAGLASEETIQIDRGELTVTRLLTNQTGGSVTLANGVLRAGGSLTMTPDLSNAVGGTIASTAGVNDIFAAIENRGTLSATNNSVLRIHEDVDSRAGTINVFEGSRAVFLGNLDLRQGELFAELDNTPESEAFGVAEVVGSVALGAELSFSLPPGAEPEIGDVFGVLSVGGEIDGTPQIATAPLLPQPLEWDVLIRPGSVSVQVVSALAGDFNGDGVVNAADFTVWRDGFSEQRFTIDDYLAFQANFGAAIGQQIAAAPEPSGLVIGLLFATAAACCRPRNRTA